MLKWLSKAFVDWQPSGVSFLSFWNFVTLIDTVKMDFMGKLSNLKKILKQLFHPLQNYYKTLLLLRVINRKYFGKKTALLYIRTKFSLGIHETTIIQDKMFLVSRIFSCLWKKDKLKEDVWKLISSFPSLSQLLRLFILGILFLKNRYI